MPCYHFTVQGEPQSADDGMSLPDIASARMEAVRLAGAILRDAPEQFWSGKAWNLDVCNCEHAALFTLSMTCLEGAVGARAADHCPEDE